MLCFLGILGLFLILDILAVVALSKGIQVLEKNIAVNYIEHDVDLMVLKFNPSDSNLTVCKALSSQISVLKKIKLTENPTSVEIQAAQIQIIQTAQEAGHCFREQGLQCVLNKMGHCTQKSLYVLAESVSVSGRQMKVDFTDEEKQLYREITELDSTDFDKEKVINLADRAIPVFKETLQRLSRDFEVFKKRNLVKT